MKHIAALRWHSDESENKQNIPTLMIHIGLLISYLCAQAHCANQVIAAVLILLLNNVSKPKIIEMGILNIAAS